MLSLILLLSLFFSIFTTISSRPSLWKGGKNNTWVYIDFVSFIVWFLINMFIFIYMFEYQIMIQFVIEVIIGALPFFIIVLSCFIIFYISKGAFLLIRNIISYFYTFVNKNQNK
mgnify:CR=1 FL=1